MELLTGLFFGSFNPVHNGHLQIARYLLQEDYCQEVWFVVSPQNPLKQEVNLLEENKRLEILNAAIGKEEGMRVCDIEFKMPRPSYTIDTLRAMEEKWLGKKFALIIGEDNRQNFYLWKQAATIAENYRILVYPRKGTLRTTFRGGKNFFEVNAPLADISSTEIRQMVREGKDISGWVPSEALRLIEKYYSGHEK